jgi:hypothetical protein
LTCTSTKAFYAAAGADLAAATTFFANSNKKNGRDFYYTQQAVTLREQRAGE